MTAADSRAMNVEPLFGLERFGESDTFAFAMVELLEKTGWQPAFVAPVFGREPAGAHVVAATKYGREVRAAASTRAEAVRSVLREISRIEESAPVAVEEGEQLTLDDEAESWEDWFASLPRTPPQ